MIKSGRRQPQVLEDARLMGQTAYIYEAGCAVMMDGEDTVLIGDFRADDGRTVYETIVDRGVPELLFESFAPALEYHAPWHTNREHSHLFRGKIDVAEANAILEREGHGALKLIDNGAIVRQMDGVEGRAHAYHLMPAAASKANAVSFHMRARGYAPEECIAIGDSVEDLSVARGRRPLLRPRQRPRARPRPARGDRPPLERHGHRGRHGRRGLRGGRRRPSPAPDSSYFFFRLPRSR